MPDDSQERAAVVDFASAKRRLSDASRHPCPKCGKRISRDAQRCPHCGVWFSASIIEGDSGLDWRTVARRLVTWTLLALLAALTLIGIYATFFAPPP